MNLGTIVVHKYALGNMPVGAAIDTEGRVTRIFAEANDTIVWRYGINHLGRARSFMVTRNVAKTSRLWQRHVPTGCLRGIKMSYQHLCLYKQLGERSCH